MADIYQIRVKGHLDHHWSGHLNDLTLTHCEDGTTILAGPILDQAALYGVLLKLRDLGVLLLSVNRIEVNAKYCG
jgi:hypothetical protein